MKYILVIQETRVHITTGSCDTCGELITVLAGSKSYKCIDCLKSTNPHYKGHIPKEIINYTSQQLLNEMKQGLIQMENPMHRSKFAKKSWKRIDLLK